MSSPEIIGVGSQANTEHQRFRTVTEVTDTALRYTIEMLHHQGTEGTEPGDYSRLVHGLNLLEQLSNVFPDQAARLADNPDFLSN